MIKVFITKYALTRGIIEGWTKDVDVNTKRICVANNVRINSYYHVNEFHLTREEAVKDAEKRRQEKIQSLEKQIEKLKSLKF